MAIGKAQPTKKATAAVVPIKCGVKDLVAGGALPQGYYLFENVRTGIAKYMSGEKAPALMADLVPVNEAGEKVGEARHQFWSAGHIDRIVPLKDGEVADEGTGFGAINGASGISDNANYSIFMQKLVEAGMPEDFVEDDVTVLEGLVGLIVQTAAPDRPGIRASSATTKEKEETKRPQVIYVVGEVRVAPWEEEEEKPAAKPAAKKAAAPAKKAAKIDPIEVLQEGLTALLDGKDASKKKALRLKLYQWLKNEAKLEQADVDSVLGEFDSDSLEAVLEAIEWQIDAGGNLTPAE